MTRRPAPVGSGAASSAVAQCAIAARASGSMVAIERVSWNARMPSMPCSRPMPGLLHAAERGAQVEARGAVVVDQDVAADQLRPTRVAVSGSAVQTAAAQPAPGVVGDAYGFLFGVERDDRDDRTELLLRHDAQTTGPGRRRSRGAGSCRPRGRRRAARRTRARRARILGLFDDLGDERLLHGGVQRAHRGALVEPVADARPSRAAPTSPSTTSCIRERCTIDALGVHADLTGRVEDRRVQAVEVHVVDDRRPRGRPPRRCRPARASRGSATSPPSP